MDVLMIEVLLKLKNPFDMTEHSCSLNFSYISTSPFKHCAILNTSKF